MPSAASTLPAEILSSIFQDAIEKASEDTDGGDKLTNLSNLSVVCPKWRSVAQSKIFSNFVIDGETWPSILKEIATNEQRAHIGTYITTLIFYLPPDPDVYKLPPEFPQFLRRLTTLRDMKLLGDSGSHLFGDLSTPELREALLHVFRLPTFNILSPSTPYFPLRVLSHCPNLDTITIRWSERVPPNYDAYVLVQGADTSVVKLKVLELVGDAENISKFAHFMADPQNKINVSQLRQLSLACMESIPKGSGTIFTQCGSIKDLKIIFGVTAGETHRFEVDEADIAVLKNIRNISFQQLPAPSRGGPPDGLDYFVTGGLFGHWLLGVLANLPNPELVKEVEYIFNPPEARDFEDENEAEEWMEAIQETAGDEDESFDDVFSEIDRLLTSQFTALSTLIIRLPWMDYDYIGKKLPGLHGRGILKE